MRRIILRSLLIVATPYSDPFSNELTILNVSDYYVCTALLNVSEHYVCTAKVTM